MVSFQALFPSVIELTMVLRMVYWCTPIVITHQRSIFYTLASIGRHWLLHFLSKHVCKLQIKYTSTYVGGANTTISGLWYLSKIFFSHGKIAWASNMNPKELNFYIFVELSSITKKGEIERSLLVLVIEWQPRWTNCVYVRYTGD